MNPLAANLIYRIHKQMARSSQPRSNTKVQWTPLIECRMLPGMETPIKRSPDDSPLLSIVDDDVSVRESLLDLLREFGFATQAFSSAEEFLSSGCVEETCCLILDVAMPGMNGPELFQELKRRGQMIPTIFVTGQKNETIQDRLLKQGALAFLLKPLDDDALVAAIKTALQAT